MVSKEDRIKWREDYQKWLESRKCKTCEVSVDVITFDGFKFASIIDVDGEKPRGEFYCKNCAKEAQEKLIQSRVVEIYEGEPIYEKDGRFYPHWRSFLTGDTIEQGRVLRNPPIPWSVFSAMPLFKEEE